MSELLSKALFGGAFLTIDAHLRTICPHKEIVVDRSR